MTTRCRPHRRPTPIIVTILAGLLNYAGVNPEISCHYEFGP